MQRPNHYLHVEQVNGNREKLAYLAELLPRFPGTGIIYTSTKHDAEMVAAFLQQQGINAEYYHSGRDEEVRQDIEQKLMASYYKVVCSTNALGMGIDKADIRFIIHYQIPASPIHYYQEIGRAGRDGKVAWCILLYDHFDLTIQEYFIRTGKPEGKCYEGILSLLRIVPQGLHDLMRETGYAQSVVRNVLSDLEEQLLVEHNLREHTFTAVPRLGQLNFSSYDTVREQKQIELGNMQNYAELKDCYMEYLTTYLGDQVGYHCRACGQCQASNFPLIKPSLRMYQAVMHFLEEGFTPCRLDSYALSSRGNQWYSKRTANWGCRGQSPLTGFGVSPEKLFFLFSPPQAAKVGRKSEGHPRTPGQGLQALSTPLAGWSSSKYNNYTNCPLR